MICIYNNIYIMCIYIYITYHVCIIYIYIYGTPPAPEIYLEDPGRLFIHFLYIITHTQIHIHLHIHK